MTNGILKMLSEGKKSKKIRVIVETLVCVVFVIALAHGVRVNAFDKYEITDDNDLLLEFKQKQASSTATYRYETGKWYLHKGEKYGATDDLTASDFSISKGVLVLDADRIDELTTAPDTNGIYWETRKMKAADLVEWALTYYAEGNTASEKREWLLYQQNGLVKAFASRSFIVLKNGSQIGSTYYCYNAIEQAAKDLWDGSWSGGALKAMEASYDKPISFTLGWTNFTVYAEDIANRGTNNLGQLAGTSSERYFYGESVSASMTDLSNAGYKYEGYELKVGGSVKETGMGSSWGALLQTSTLGSGNIELTFLYSLNADNKPDDDDDPPSGGPVTTPPVTTPPITTPPITTPPVTTAPQKYRKKDEADIRYFTTGQGYTLDAIANNSSYYLANNTGKTGAGRITSHAAITRAQSYLIGTDANNNTWYFIADGTNATYVHPATYGSGSTKYNADTAEVKYITELTFPDTITYNGTVYTVVSIGGGSPTYHTVTSSSTSTSSSDYGIVTGLTYYSYETGNATYQDYYDVEYIYGVLGTGYIESIGEKAYNTDSGYYYRYENSYHVYNTTLKEITIPSTVTTICQYAFFYCEELSIINGGDGLITIEPSAFRAATHKTPMVSEVWSWSTSDTESTGGRYYYYDGAYSTSSVTSAMRAWETAVAFRYYMVLPEFPVLKSINWYAFAYHTNLYSVTLSEATSGISTGAFQGCQLEFIKIPCKTASVSDNVNTLGTKGNVSNKTVIYAEPEATSVIDYGRTYDDYYTLKAGYKVIYHANDGSGKTETATTALENLYADIALASTYFKVDYDGTVWNSQKPICRAGEPDTEKPMISDNYSIIYHGTDGNVYCVYYFLYYSGDKLKTHVISLSSEIKALTNVSGSYIDHSVTFSYTATDGSRYNCVVAYDGTVTETLYSAAPTPTPTPEAKAFSYEFRYMANRRAGKSSADNKLYYLDEAYGKWYTISTKYYPQASYTYSAVWSGTHTPMGYYDDEQGAYVDKDKEVYYALTTAGTFYYKCPDTTNTWFSFSTGITSKISWVRQVYYGDGNDADSYSWSIMQDVNGNVYLVKAYLGAYNSTSAANNSKAYNLGVTDGMFSGTLRTMSRFNDYQLYDNRPYSNDIDADGMLFLLTDTGAFYSISVPSAGYYNHDDPILARLGSDTTYFTEDNIHFQNYGLNDPAERSEGLYYGPSFFFGDLGIVALDNEGKVWCTGVHNADIKPFGDAGYTPDYYSTGDVPLSAYLSMTDISNGMTYTDIVLYGHILAIGTDKKLYAAGCHVTDRITTGNGTYFTCGYDFHVVYDSEECRMFLPRNYYSTEQTVVTEKGEVYFKSSTYSPYTIVRSVIYDKGYQFSGTILYNTFFPRGGYDFKTWNTRADGTGTEYTPGTKVVLTGDLDLHAQWEASLPTIHYEPNGGSGGMTDTVLPQGVTSTYLARNRFYYTDHTFDYWCQTMADCPGRDAAGHIHYDDQAYVTGVTGYIELYAQWKEVEITYTLVYMTYPYGSAGNTVWKTKTMKTSISNTRSETIEGQPMTPDNYTVTYDTNRGDAMSSIPVMGTLTSANTTPSLPVFEQWQMRIPDANGVQQYYGVNYAPGDVVTRLTNTDGAILYLYPSWGDSYVILPNATCNGYTLRGWCEVPDGSLEIYLPNDEDSTEVSTYVPVRNTTLYAIWEPDTAGVFVDFSIADTTDSDEKEKLNAGMQALILKTGHKFVYTVSAREQSNDLPEQIRITPCYFWISDDESIRKECNVYYHVFTPEKKFYFLLAGDEKDTRNGLLQGSILLENFRLNEGKRVWQAEFLLPTEVFPVYAEEQWRFEKHIKEELLTGREEFFLKEGYLVVAFRIEYKAESGDWIVFDNWQQTKVYQDAVAAGWNCMPGDVIRYDLRRKSSEDYEIGGLE